MKKFEFRLEKVQRWREIQLRLQEERARKALEMVERAKRELVQLTDRSEAAARQIQSGETTIAFPSYGGFVKRVESDRGRIHTALTKLQSAAALEQRRLVESHRNVRLLEKLHDTRLAAWTADLNRENDQFAEEAFLGRVQSEKRARSSGG